MRAALLALLLVGCAASDERSAAPRPVMLHTHLMFEGRAEEALELYTGLFPDARVHDIERWAAGEPGPEGSFKLARLTLAGHELSIFDSPIEHPFSFTPSTSLFVTCQEAAEVDRLVAALSDGGQVLMPLDAYEFSPRFCYLTDRFGVAWQIGLPPG